MFSLASVCSWGGKAGKSHGGVPPRKGQVRYSAWERSGRVCPLSLIFGGHHWRPVQTCPFVDPPLELHLVVAVEARLIGTSGRHASYWNAFLFTTSFW